MTNDLADIKLYDQNPDEAAVERLGHRLALVMKNKMHRLLLHRIQKK